MNNNYYGVSGNTGVDTQTFQYLIKGKSKSGKPIANINAGYGPYLTESDRNDEIKLLYGNNIPDGLTTAIYNGNALKEYWYFNNEWQDKNVSSGSGIVSIDNYLISTSPTTACVPVNSENKCTVEALKTGTKTTISARYKGEIVDLSSAKIWANASLTSDEIGSFKVKYKGSGKNLEVWLEPKNTQPDDMIEVTPQIYLLYFILEGQVTLTSGFNFILDTISNSSVKMTANPSTVVITGDKQVSDYVYVDIDGYDYLNKLNYNVDLSKYNINLYLCDLSGNETEVFNYKVIDNLQIKINVLEIVNNNTINTGYYLKIVLNKNNSKIIQSIVFQKMEDIKGYVVQSSSYSLSRNCIIIPSNKINLIGNNKYNTLTKVIKGTESGDEYVKIESITFSGVNDGDYEVTYYDNDDNPVTNDSENKYGYSLSKACESDGVTVVNFKDGEKDMFLYQPIYISNDISNWYNVSAFPLVAGRNGLEVEDDITLEIWEDGTKLDSINGFTIERHIGDTIVEIEDLIDEGIKTVSDSIDSIIYEFYKGSGDDKTYVGTVSVSVYDIPLSSELLYQVNLTNDVVIVDNDSYNNLEDLSKTNVTITPSDEPYFVEVILLNNEESNDLDLHVTGNCDSENKLYTYINNVYVTSSKNSALKKDLCSVVFRVFKKNADGTKGKLLTTKSQSIKIIDINDGLSYRLNVSPNIIPLLYNSNELKLFGVNDSIMLSKLNITATIFDGKNPRNVSFNSADFPKENLYLYKGATQVDPTATISVNDFIHSGLSGVNLYLKYKYIDSNGITSYITVDKETIGYTKQGEKGTDGVIQGLIQLTNDTASFDIDSSVDSVKKVSTTIASLYKNNLKQKVCWKIELSSELNDFKIQYSLDGSSASGNILSLLPSVNTYGEELKLNLIKPTTLKETLQGYATISAYEYNSNKVGSLLGSKIFMVNAYDIPGAASYSLNVVPNVITTYEDGSGNNTVNITLSKISDDETNSEYANLSNFILTKQFDGIDEKIINASGTILEDTITNNSDVIYKVYYGHPSYECLYDDETYYSDVFEKGTNLVLKEGHNFYYGTYQYDYKHEDLFLDEEGFYAFPQGCEPDTYFIDDAEPQDYPEIIKTSINGTLIDSETVGVIKVPAAVTSGYNVTHTNDNVLIDDNSVDSTLAITTKNIIKVFNGKELKYGTDYTVSSKLFLKDYFGNNVSDLLIEEFTNEIYYRTTLKRTIDSDKNITSCSGCIEYTITPTDTNEKSFTTQLNITVMDYSDGKGFYLSAEPNSLAVDWNRTKFIDNESETHNLNVTLECCPNDSNLTLVTRDPSKENEYCIVTERRESAGSNEMKTCYIGKDGNITIYPDMKTITFKALYYSKEAKKAITVDTETVNIIREGSLTKGIDGSVIRFIGNWSDVKNSTTSGIDYFCCKDRVGERDVTYIDVIYLDEIIEGTNPGYYQCVSGHNNTSKFIVTNWEAAEYSNFIASGLVLSESSKIKFSLTNLLLLQDENDIIVGGAKGANSKLEKDLVYWAGSKIQGGTTEVSNEISAENAPFRVYNNGHVDANDITVKGNVEASSFVVKHTDGTNAIEFCIWNDTLRSTYSNNISIGSPVLIARDLSGKPYIILLSELVPINTSNSVYIVPMQCYQVTSNSYLAQDPSIYTLKNSTLLYKKEGIYYTSKECSNKANGVYVLGNTNTINVYYDDSLKEDGKIYWKSLLSKEELSLGDSVDYVLGAVCLGNNIISPTDKIEFDSFSGGTPSNKITEDFLNGKSKIVIYRYMNIEKGILTYQHSGKYVIEKQ